MKLPRPTRSAATMALLVVVVAVSATWWLREDSTGVPDRPEPVALTAAGPRFADPGELIEASDLVVVAAVVAIDSGRTISDPADPAAGIRTQLARLDVSEVLVGSASGPVIVEQEATLLDGTRVVVNGVEALAEGDAGVFFLVRGDTEEFPYTALVNEQAWLPIVDGLVRPVDPVDPVWIGWAGRTEDDLVTAVFSEV